MFYTHKCYQKLFSCFYSRHSCERRNPVNALPCAKRNLVNWMSVPAFWTEITTHTGVVKKYLHLIYSSWAGGCLGSQPPQPSCPLHSVRHACTTARHACSESRHSCERRNPPSGRGRSPTSIRHVLRNCSSCLRTQASSIYRPFLLALMIFSFSFPAFSVPVIQAKDLKISPGNFTTISCITPPCSIFNEATQSDVTNSSAGVLRCALGVTGKGVPINCTSNICTDRLTATNTIPDISAFDSHLCVDPNLYHPKIHNIGNNPRSQVCPTSGYTVDVNIGPPDNEANKYIRAMSYRYAGQWIKNYTPKCWAGLDHSECPIGSSSTSVNEHRVLLVDLPDRTTINEQQHCCSKAVNAAAPPNSGTAPAYGAFSATATTANSRTHIAPISTLSSTCNVKLNTELGCGAFCTYCSGSYPTNLTGVATHGQCLCNAGADCGLCKKCAGSDNSINSNPPGSDPFKCINRPSGEDDVNSNCAGACKQCNGAGVCQLLNTPPAECEACNNGVHSYLTGPSCSGGVCGGTCSNGNCIPNPPPSCGTCENLIGCSCVLDTSCQIPCTNPCETRQQGMCVSSCTGSDICCSGTCQPPPCGGCSCQSVTCGSCSTCDPNSNCQCNSISGCCTSNSDCSGCSTCQSGSCVAPSTSCPGQTWNSSTCSCVNCSCGSWSPAPSTICNGQSFTQTRSCTPSACNTESQSATGTKYCPPTCNCGSWGGWGSWTPAPSTACSGQSFTQTRNRSRSCTPSACNTETDTDTQPSTGTKNCQICNCGSWGGWGSYSPATSTVCSGQSFTQTRNRSRSCTPSACNTETDTDTQPSTGTKNCQICNCGSWGGWGSYSPATSTVCSGQSFTQTRNRSRSCTPSACNTETGTGSRSATGTKNCCTCGSYGSWGSYSPAPSTVCSGQSFTQTRNRSRSCTPSACNTETDTGSRSATGTKNCCTCGSYGSWGSYSPAPSTVCSGQSFTQTRSRSRSCTPSGCATTSETSSQSTTGTKCCCGSYGSYSAFDNGWPSQVCTTDTTSRYKTRTCTPSGCMSETHTDTRAGTKDCSCTCGSYGSYSTFNNGWPSSICPDQTTSRTKTRTCTPSNCMSQTHTDTRSGTKTCGVCEICQNGACVNDPNCGTTTGGGCQCPSGYSVSGGQCSSMCCQVGTCLGQCISGDECSSTNSCQCPGSSTNHHPSDFCYTSCQ